MDTQLSTSEGPSCHPVQDPAGAADGCCLWDGNVGDERAWELLVRRYQPYLLRLAASYRIHEDAHDAVQTTFLRLLEHGGAIRKPEAVKSWLAAVLRRECLAAVRRRQREQPADLELDGLLPASWEPDLDDALLVQEDAEFLQEALSRLTARHRELLELLSDPDTSSYRTVSERLGMPIGSIGPTRQRALLRLHDALSTTRYEAAV